MFVVSLPGLWPSGQELEEIRGRHLLRSTQPQVGDRRLPRRTQEPVLGFPIQKQLHPDTKEAKGLLLVQCTARSLVPRCSRARFEEGEDGTGGYHCRRRRTGPLFRV